MADARQNERRVAITGASGLVGSTLGSALSEDGWSVTRVVRSREKAAADDATYWRPSRGEIDASGLEDHDVVIHLAGESLFGVWTPAKKERIRRSRMLGTQLLASALAGLDSPPATLITASAVGYYGDRPGETLDETSGRGDGFLADVVSAWEEAAAPAEEVGIRVVHLRLGLVLSPKGGLLDVMKPVFKLGLGAVPGSGDQVWSWVALPELPGIVGAAIGNDEMKGPVNATSPGAVTARAFCETLGRVLHRPVPFRVPGALVDLAPGGMGGELVLASQDVRPARLLDDGYAFRFTELEPTLRELLGRA